MSKVVNKDRIKILFLIGILLSVGIGCKKDTVSKNNVSSLVATDWQAGDVFFDQHQWTECDVGNMPLVISIPHGGDIKPEGVPDRSCPGKVVTVTDGWTIPLGRAISKALEDKYHVKPYLVICHIKRSKIELNRAVDDPVATCGNEKMIAPWHQFHDYIDTALANAVHDFGHALYIDLHAHGHDIQRLELGYNLNRNQLGKVSLKSDLEKLWHASSIHQIPILKKGMDFHDYLIGDKAFGTLMEERGYRAIPSQKEPFPQVGEGYFNGGYNTRRYTAVPKVFGWQIESNYKGVRDNKENRAAFGEAFADVIVQYLHHTMNFNYK